MMHSFFDLVIGDVYVAPFVGYALMAFAIILAARPILHLLRFGKLFSHPAIAELSLYVVALGLLTVFV